MDVTHCGLPAGWGRQCLLAPHPGPGFSGSQLTGPLPVVATVVVAGPTVTDVVGPTSAVVALSVVTVVVAACVFPLPPKPDATVFVVLLPVPMPVVAGTPEPPVPPVPPAFAGSVAPLAQLKAIKSNAKARQSERLTSYIVVETRWLLQPRFLPDATFACDRGAMRDVSGRAERPESEIDTLRKLANELAKERKERVTSVHLLAAMATRSGPVAELFAESLIGGEVLLKAGRSFDEDHPEALHLCLDDAR